MTRFAWLKRFHEQLIGHTFSLRRTARRACFPCDICHLEARTLLSAINLRPTADATVTDTDRDGVFDGTSDTTSITSRNFDLNPSLRYEERGVFEFDLRPLAGGTVTTDVRFQFNVSSYTNSGAVYPEGDVYLYVGDGSLSASDGHSSASLATRFTVNATGEKAIVLTAAQIQPFVGGYLGLRIVNPNLDGEWFTLRSSESTDGPQLTLEADVPSALSITLSTDSVLENAGTSAAIGTVTRTGDLSQKLVVELSSSDLTEATVPASITIPANEASASFAVNAVDDSIIDGSKTLSIQAVGQGPIDAMGTITADSTFGSSGAKTISAVRDHALVARQSDDKLLVVGRSSSNTGAWTVTRLLPDGSLDSTFGTGGQISTIISPAYSCSPGQILVQPDGKIVVAGHRNQGSGVPVVVRYLADGTLDPGFGFDGIIPITATEGYVSDAVLQSDGKILVSIYYSGSGVTFRVVRLNSNGTQDSTFGTNGLRSYTGASGFASDLLVRSDNSFFIAGDDHVVRCFANGATDLAFGVNGIVTLESQGSVIRLSRISEQTDGALVIAGDAYPAGSQGVITNNDTFLARLTATGMPDVTFGQNGRVVMDLAPGTNWLDTVTGLFVQPNGKLLTVGIGWIADNDYWNVIARWNTNGTLDQTFDGDGLIRADYSPGSTASIWPSAVLQPDGKLLVTTGWSPNIAVRRINTSTTAPRVGYAAWASLEVRDVEQGNTAPDLRTQSFVVPENAPINSTVATVAATDIESPQSLEYVITGGNTGETFSINSATGAILVADATLLDFENPTPFQLTIAVHDHGSPNLVDTGTVHLILSDVNEAPSLSAQTLAVMENSSVGTVVGSVIASDHDMGQSPTYSIQSGNTNGAFAIHATTGAITVANPAALDFEATPIFSLNVQVIDNGSPNLSASGVVTITLQNEFEVTSSALQAIVPLYQYPLSAPNVLNDWWQRVLDGATADNPITVVINPASGPIDPAAGGADYNNYLAALSLLRANPNIRILGYVATGFGLTDSATILQRVGWYASGYKHITTSASLIDGIFLDEMSNQAAHIGTYTTVAVGIRGVSGLAGQFIVGNPGTSVPLSYLDQNTADLFITREGTPSDLLSETTPAYVTSPTYAALSFGTVIHSASGSASLALVLRETKRRGYDYVFVTDDGGGNPYDQVPTYFADFLRDIHAPYITSTGFSIPENTANGTAVGTVTAGDPDPEQTLAYSITGGNANGAFAIHPMTGQITVNNSAALNFESASSIPIEIRVTDNGSPTLNDTVTVTVTITDVNEAPMVALQNVISSLPENTDTTSRVKVADITVTDDALGSNVKSLTGLDTTVFEIINDGLYIKAGTILDFESKATYDVTVNVDDASVGGNPDASAALTLSITDANDTPLIGGLPANQSVNDTATLSPFSGITVGDPDTQNMLAKVTIANGVFRGDFTAASTAGWTRTVIGNNIEYSRFYSSQANIGSVVQAALRGFVFDPRTNAIKPNTIEQTDITVFVNDGQANTSATTRITTTSVNDVPAIGGTVYGQPVNDSATVAPFASLTVADADMQEMLIGVTILNGKFRGDFTPASVAGWTRTTLGNNITYKRYFNPQANGGAAAQAAFRALVFQPRTNAIKPNTTELTDFQITLSDGVAPAIANTATRVVTTSVNDVPTIGGTSNTITVNDNATVNPFANLTMADADRQQMLVSVTILNGQYRGDFTNATSTGWTVRYTTGNDITYKRYFSPQADVGAAAQAAFRALVFQPRQNAIKPGMAEATDFQITVSDGVAPAIANTETRVTTTSVNNAPTITGAVADQAMNNNQTRAVFNTLTVTDPDTQDTLATVTITNGTTRGDFTAASATGWTRTVSSGNIIYSRYFAATTNIGAAVQTAIRAMVFQPRNNVPVDTTEITTFTVAVKDGSAATATDSTTSVVTTGVAARVLLSKLSLSMIADDDIATIVLPTGLTGRSDRLRRWLKTP